MMSSNKHTHKKKKIKSYNLHLPYIHENPPIAYITNSLKRKERQFK